MAERLSYWDYVRAAFWKPVRSRVLGAMPLTQMLLASFGIAGFINPGFWLLGLAGVVAFVGGRSASERFQKLVEGERLLARSGSAEDKMKAAYERLQPASQSRYRALVVVCREVLGIGGGEGSLGDFRTGNLNQMLWLFLRLLASREAITDTLARIDRRQLETGLESLKSRVAGAGDAPAAGAGPGPRRLGARALAARHARDPAEAAQQSGRGDQQPGRDRRRARADRAAGAAGARGERCEPLAGSALFAARRRLLDAQRDLALDGPARGPDVGRDLGRPGRRGHRGAAAGALRSRRGTGAGAGGAAADATADGAAPAVRLGGPDA
jgi:hypothetical protein